MWKVYRGKKKSDQSEVSIFIFEKKGKTYKNLKQETIELFKRDPANLAKFRHPSMLKIIDAPMEDKSVVAFVSEPVEYNISAIAFDP